MRYLLNRAVIFDAAEDCCSSRKPKVATGGVLTREDAERAFAEWTGEFGWAQVSMRLTSSANGDVAAEFTTDPA
jgi:hypothetical protein